MKNLIVSAEEGDEEMGLPLAGLSSVSKDLAAESRGPLALRTRGRRIDLGVNCPIGKYLNREPKLLFTDASKDQTTMIVLVLTSSLEAL
jgi:hypothetical protein